MISREAEFDHPMANTIIQNEDGFTVSYQEGGYSSDAALPMLWEQRDRGARRCKMLTLYTTNILRVH